MNRDKVLPLIDALAVEADWDEESDIADNYAAAQRDADFGVYKRDVEALQLAVLDAEVRRENAVAKLERVQPLIELAQRLHERGVGHDSSCAIVWWNEELQQDCLDPEACNCVARELRQALAQIGVEVKDAD